MSQDLRLKHKCPHQVAEEWLQISRDRRTLRPVRSPATSRVKILKNRVRIPREGLYSTVQVTGLKTQPYEIESGDNDELKLQVNGSEQTVSLPVGRRVKASDLVEPIRDQTTGILVSTDRGRVVLTLETQGHGSTLKFQDGNGHQTLGFPDLRFFRSREIHTGWDLVKDQRSEDPTARLILFHEPLPTEDDIFEVTYTTRQAVCRRCMGLGIEHDLRHDVEGQPVFVDNESLMLQEVDKILFTVRGSNAFHSWYGSSLSELIGSKIIGGGGYMQTQLISDIGETLNRYQTIKEQQSRFQPTTKRELLEQVVSVDVEQDAGDPTVFHIAIELRSRSGEFHVVEDTIVLSDLSFAQGFQRRIK